MKINDQLRRNLTTLSNLPILNAGDEWWTKKIGRLLDEEDTTHREEFMISFGSGQYDDNHSSLANVVAMVVATSGNEAREMAFKARDAKFCAVYSGAAKFNYIAEWNPTIMQLSEITKQAGETK